MTLPLLLFLFPLAYSPGPGNIYFAAIGGSFGWRTALAPLAGYHAATIVVTVAVGFGFSALAQINTAALEGLRYAGAAYMLWLALGFLRAGATAQTAKPRSATAVDGAILLVVNPKAYVIIGLMFSQFLTGTAGAVQVVFITLVFTANNLVAFVLWTIAGDMLTQRFRNAQNARPINVTFAVMLASVAIYMAAR
ncbi:MAG: LysE family translocator [Cypionkella sp.]|nr:LysE family translocator [Cypionkella sp.]